jgi:acyl carrier protein
VKRDELRAVVAEILEVEPSALQTAVELSSFDNFDSVILLSLMIRLDEAANIKMTPADVPKLRTYGDIESLATRQGIELTD